MARNEETAKAKIKIIYTLHQKRYYNKRHTPIDFLCKRNPKIACKTIKKAINELKKEDILIMKPTYHGTDVSLNVKKKKEIDEYLNQLNIKKSKKRRD